MKRQSFFIKSIRVVRLFGHLSYDLDFTQVSSSETPRFAALYGDNGAGKTTILKLLFHIISPVDNRGHKSVIGRTRFSRFEVELLNGLKVIAQRSKGATTGDLQFRVERPGEKPIILEVPTEKDGTFKIKDENQSLKLIKLLDTLRSINIEFIFMRDDRRLTSSLDENVRAEEISDEINPWEIDYRLDAITRRQFTRGGSNLESAVVGAQSYFRNQALDANKKGEGDTGKIYDTLIKQLVNPDAETSSIKVEQFQQLMETLEQLAERNERYVHVGLTTPMLAADMIKTLKRARGPAVPALINVLNPYFDGVNARLSALQPLCDLIYMFINALNSFLSNGKKVAFHVARGLTIQGFDGEIIHPNLLSSGERQLLLIFCQSICARDKAAIFIIDEPEISLNVKWQRRLVQSLLDCTDGASVQFLMASHSIELLATHQENIVQLTSGGEQ